MNLINFRGIDKKNAENRKHPHLKIHSHAQREPTHRSAERKQQPSNYTHTHIHTARRPRRFLSSYPEQIYAY